MIKISKGNMKMGKVPSVSLPPIHSCPEGVPCTKSCYALKAYRSYPSASAAWNTNYWLLQQDPHRYFEEIFMWLYLKQPIYFRWQVAGDITGPGYLEKVAETASKLHLTKFLAFTKNYEALSDPSVEIPPNLTIVLSAWPGWVPSEELRERFRVAWMRPKEPVDGYEIPEEALDCLGNCESCGLCFSLNKVGKDIVFNKH